MRRLIVFAVLIAIMLAGGGLTAQLISGGSASLLPVLNQVGNPDASPTVMQDWKANQLFLLIGFIVTNLVGIALTLAIIFWLIDRGLKKSRAEASEMAANTNTDTASS